MVEEEYRQETEIERGRNQNLFDTGLVGKHKNSRLGSKTWEFFKTGSQQWSLILIEYGISHCQHPPRTFGDKIPSPHKTGHHVVG